MIMRLFLLKIIVFSCLMGLCLLIGLFIIRNPSAKHTLLGETVHKRKLLENTQQAKIVFVGGSNLSHGLDSGRIFDEFNRPVVNMGVHGGLGLAYMINEVKPYIRKNDIIVVVPEYGLFQGGYYGNVETLGVVFDILPEYKKLITLRHWIHLLRYMPNYAAIKWMNVFCKWGRRGGEIASHYNQYGDRTIDWNLKSQPLAPVKPKTDALDLIGFDELERLYSVTQKLEAHLFILPPCYQATSYDNMPSIINRIEEEFKRRGLPLRAKPMRYRMNDDLHSDTPYHLTKAGVDLRTSLVIEDLHKIFDTLVEEDRIRDHDE